MTSSTPIVPLTIAGSDPSGGAGLQGDLKVFLQHGLSGAAVPTALTVQSTSGTVSMHPVPGRLVQKQLEALLADVRPAAVKVGMLGSGENVRVVSRVLAPLARRGIPIVVDPVLAATDGLRLLPKADVPLFLRLLVPLATLLTPNLSEAAELAGVEESRVRKHTDEVVQSLVRAGAKGVLVKGGHLSTDEAIDVLGTREELILFSVPRIPRRRRVHGTGCALSAAITARLARGESLEQAVQHSKDYVTSAIRAARHIGRGARQLEFRVEED